MVGNHKFLWMSTVEPGKLAYEIQHAQQKMFKQTSTFVFLRMKRPSLRNFTASLESLEHQASQDAELT